MDLIAVFRPTRSADVKDVSERVIASRLELEAAVAGLKELTSQERTIKLVLDEQRKRRPPRK